MAARKQECIKKLAGKCHLCAESDYHVLDAHRIIPGRDGGKYSWENNVISVCACCHRRIESGEISILGSYLATNGKRVLHIKKDNKEDWIWFPSIVDKKEE